MTPSEKAQIERACERLISQYNHYVDHNETEALVSLFAEDATWTAEEMIFDGKEQIAMAFQMRASNQERTTRHLCTNLVVTVESEASASAVCYLTLYRHDGLPKEAYLPLDGPAMIGEYIDRFVLTESGWRFQSRKLQGTFLKPGTSMWG